MEILDRDLYRSAKTGRKKAGQKALLDHLSGKKITKRQAISAKCYDCNGMGEQDDCDIVTCPLYGYSPMVTRREKIRRSIAGASPRAKVAYPGGA